VFAAHQFGGSLAAFAAGALHTWQGDYLVAFMSAGALALLASGLVMGLSRPAAAPPLATRQPQPVPTAG
jgi:hypothetical protein